VSWRVEYAGHARRDLRNLDKSAAERVIRALDRLAETERGDFIQLAGHDPPEWRLRVGQYRVRFAFLHETQTIEVLRVLPRSRAYRD
jgi:mRNA-degrading endonuclease RelE of RelBE toxin-antitoxin system